MKRVPKRNDGGRLADIRPPASVGPRPEPPPPPPSIRTELIARPSAPPPPARKRRQWARSILWTAGVTLAFMALIAVGGWYRLQDRIRATAVLGIQTLHSALSDFKLFNLRPENVGLQEEQFRELTRSFAPFDSILTGGWGQTFLPAMKDLGQMYQDFQIVSGSAFEMLDDLTRLQSLWPKALLGESGGEVIAALESVERNLGRIGEAGNRLSSQSSRFQDSVPWDPGDYLSFQLEITRARNFLGALLPWLKAPGERRLALLLENPSEIRPGGGFLGSYAEIVIAGGSVKEIEMRDISYADRELATRTIPPQPLQALVKNWRAADSNWFFDFPQSAAKTLAFLEASDVYREGEVGFDGAIGISAKAIRDLLTLTGPIELPSGTVITDRNFLFEIQKQVQTGHDAGSPAAKQVLAEIAPLLIRRLSDLPPEAQGRLLELGTEWVAERDLRAYFQEPSFQRFLDSLQATGRIADVPREWIGDYLAVVNANIGGGKTDIYVKQKIHLQAQLSNEGVLSNHLVVTRTHGGNRAEEWYYKAPNQNYLQIFTAPDAQLSYANGGFDKKIAPPLKYAAEGYSADPEVKAIEDTRWDHLGIPSVATYESSGKRVFATWSRTEAGQATELTFDYSRKLPAPPEEGQVFEFIFEKQSGIEGEYLFEITAPVGFRFKENSMPVFEYRTEDPPGRLVLDLTLEKF